MTHKTVCGFDRMVVRASSVRSNTVSALCFALWLLVTGYSAAQTGEGEHAGGLSWHSGLGHPHESFTAPTFQQHIRGGIQWAAGRVDAEEGSTIAGNFEKVVLDDDITYPMELDVAPDGRVFFIERDGSVKVWDPETKSTHMAAFIPVAAMIEDGLLGLALDPNFLETNWVYLYYAPADEGPSRLSRFTMDGNELDIRSEMVLLEIPVQRMRCCHSAGSIEFGPDGNLFLSTGENGGGWNRSGEFSEGLYSWDAHWDNERSTANTNDLRGKILRIHPEPDGSYSIPAGNLFEDDNLLTRPEIYTMGHRNPFRIDIDPKTGWLFFGDVGPGNEPEEGKSPPGYEEINLVKGPGFFGWPYFVGRNEPYRDLDPETGELRGWPDPDAPINDSPNNTGIEQLPPAQPAWIWYMYGLSEEFPELGVGGMSTAVGPIYRYNADTASPHGLPEYYDGSVFIYEFMRNWIQEVKLDEEGNLLKINPFAPELSFVRPIDVEVGSDGRLYVLEWGPQFWGENREAKLVRIDYHASGKRPPSVAATAEPSSGPSPLHVAFGTSETNSRDSNETLELAWDFNGDGRVESREANPTFTYEWQGNYTAVLTATDATGLSSKTNVSVIVGNTAPQVTIDWPPDGGFFDYGRPIQYQASVSDSEDGTVLEDQVVAQSYLGHDTHTHALNSHYGLAGQFYVLPDLSHRPYVIDEFAKLDVSYTDKGAPGVDALTTRDSIVLNPKRMEAETYSDAEGTNLTITEHRGRRTFADETEVFLEVEDGAWIIFSPVNLHGIDSITLYVDPKAAGTLELRLDAADGSLLGRANIPSPSVFEQETEERRRPPIEWKPVQIPVTDPGGTHALYVVFYGAESGTLLSFDRLEFEGDGAVRPTSDPRR